MFTDYYTPGQKKVIVVGNKIDGYWDTILHKYIPFIQAHEYDLQMTVYEELIKQCFNKTCQPYIFAVSKQTPPDKIAIDFTGTDNEYSMKADLDKIKELQPHF